MSNKRYDKEEILKQAIDAVKAHRLIFIDEVITFLPVCSSTFYHYFPAESEEMAAIKAEIADSRIKSKSGLRKKWHKSDNATLQVALYKLIGSEEEVERLNGSRQKLEHTGKDGEPIEVKQITGMEIK